MAGLTKEQRAERDAAKQDDGLIEMHKGGEVIRVHPTCVKSHQAVGWRIA